MASVTVGDVKLNMKTMGDQHRDTVVMAHGLVFGNLAMWYYGAAIALAATHRVVLYDLRGHGRSARPPNGYRLEAMADDLAGVLDHAGVDRFSFVGHSYGALIGFAFALANEGRIHRMSVIDAPLPPVGEITDELRAQLDPTNVRSWKGDLDRGVKRYPRQIRNLLRAAYTLWTETSLPHDLMAEPDFDDRDLATLRFPVQLIYGRSSPCTGTAERLAATLRETELNWLDGGHFLPLEKPDEVAALLTRFVREGPR